MKKKQYKKTILTLLIILINFYIPFVYADKEYHVTTTIQSPEPNSNAGLGWSVALNEELIVIGSPGSYVDEYKSGNVLVFNSEGALLTTLEPPQTQRSLSLVFGSSISLKDNKIIIGDSKAIVREYGEGRVYLYDSSGVLIATPQSPDDEGPIRVFFGTSVSFCGDTIIASEPGQKVNNMLYAGKVYRYDIDGNLLTTFQSPNPSFGLGNDVSNAARGRGGENFGFSVAGNENTIVIGEPYVTIDGKLLAGKAHVFDCNGDLLASLESPNPQQFGKFGDFVACNSDFIVVTESEATVNGLARVGRAHVFNIGGDFLYTLHAPDPEEGAKFGFSVALGDDEIVVGASTADIVKMNEGKVYVFDLDGNLQATLVSPDPQVMAEFGYSVAISGDKIVIGEPGSKVEGVSKAGKAYVFEVGAAETTSPDATETPVKTDSQPEEGESREGIPGFPLAALITGIIVFGYIVTKNKRILSKPFFF